jgi:hypothetical protein
MVRHLVAVGLAAGAWAAAGGGCGGEPAPSPAPPAREGAPAERADRPAPLPAGWKRVVNRRAGFSVGIPPGWRARGTRGATLVRSGDRLMAVSIVADRSDDGRGLPAAVYARRTARALPGYRRLRVGPARRLRGARYPGAAVTATGTFARTGVRQAIRVVVLRRPGRVAYTLAVARSARSRGAVYRPAVRGMLRSFRARPAVT